MRGRETADKAIIFYPFAYCLSGTHLDTTKEKEQ